MTAQQLSARRPSRPLTPVQRDALERLNALGARLESAFTREELRSAFRTLARAYHPDRHTERTAAVSAHLAAKFRLIRSDYEMLRACC